MRCVLVLIILLASCGSSGTVEPTADPAQWQQTLRDLEAPPHIVAWARYSDDFAGAWKRCSDPLVRVWLARAGGLTRAEVIDGIVQLIARLVRDTELRVDQRDLIDLALGDLTSRTPPPSSELGALADQLATARGSWDGPAHDLAFALESLLHAAGNTSSSELTHLVDASAAIKAVTVGFKSRALLSAEDADVYLASAWRPSGRPPIVAKPVRIDGLTDREVVERAYERASGNEASHSDLVIALTINLEKAVLDGGFAQYFHVYGIESALGAAAAYRELGRDDLADTVERARAVALTTDAVRVFDRTAFRSLNASLWTQLKQDPTEARARYVRGMEVKRARRR